jgi:NAD(P)-dependent dehydrogenase (short-subunit alcohol dehydrogenase family)
MVAVTDLDGPGLDQTRAAVQAEGGAACAWPVDLRDADAIAGLFDAVAAGPGPAAVLVNNAAIYPATPFLDIGVGEYDDVHAVNQCGYWLCAQSAARQMQAAGAGATVNVASITMHGGWANLASYVATKGAAAALTRALARELGPSGIRVNAVSPGAFPTAAEQIYDDPAAYNQHVLDQQSLKRRGTPDELAAVVSFLAGPGASNASGQTIEVNGGWVMS